MEKTVWVIEDWAGNQIYNKEFTDFDTAEEYLSIQLGTNYYTDREEYFITEKE